MQQVIVTESAIRELIREALNSRTPDTFKSLVKTSDVVDPSAALTDPGNHDYRPDSFEELKVAFNSLIKDISQEKIPAVYRELIKVIQNLNYKKDIEPMRRKDTKVESFVRSKIRQMILENKKLFEARPKKQEGDPTKKYVTVDGDGMSLDQIAKWFGDKGASTAHGQASKAVAGVKSALGFFNLTAADLNKFKDAGKRFLARLELEALEQAGADPSGGTGESLIKADDAPFLAGELKDEIKVFTDKFLTDPENYEDPDDMMSPEDIEQLRQNPQAVVTLPLFLTQFLIDHLRDNFKLLDSMWTFRHSKEYQAVEKEMKKKYKVTDPQAQKSAMQDLMHALDRMRPE